MQAKNNTETTAQMRVNYASLVIRYRKMTAKLLQHLALGWHVTSTTLSRHPRQVLAPNRKLKTPWESDKLKSLTWFVVVWLQVLRRAQQRACLLRVSTELSFWLFRITLPSLEDCTAIVVGFCSTYLEASCFLSLIEPYKSIVLANSTASFLRADFHLFG